ncbi:sulfate transporter [Ventosimonas gracilis]|uniref:Sulfate transporter n=1 Tax=Ventosimonas gracilis TaxID=1680762 RepID=A0A139SXZ4_9GAMM|nr:SulP family inorganic anion transporter [Ventosimonas gracilis]KXU39463.1 sulfate transporter [Ventosimonas gracilis]
MLAVQEAWRAGLLGWRHWLRNLLSGVVVGVVALPLAMAFAIASGATPAQGIYTAIIAGVVVSLCGGSRFQIAGPTGAFIAILATITAKHGIDGLQMATLMAGAILLVLGFARLGSVIRFIPDPVIVGFTAGIGVIIWVSQWRDFFGLPQTQGEHFHERLWQLLQALPQLHLATTLLALAALMLVIFNGKLPLLRRLPAPLVAMVLVAGVQALFQFEGVATIGSAFGGIPQGLPSFNWPQISLARVIELIGPAFAIAMLGAIESLLSAVVADGMAGTRHDSNQELIGQGLANLTTPLFGGFAATGALARTAANIKNGASGPLSGVFHSLTLLLILLVLAPLAADIPLCALAAILFVVAWNMSDFAHFKHMLRRAPRADVVVLLVTFLLTVFSDLVLAVNIGVILAMLLFMRRMAASVAVQQQERGELAAELGQELPPDVLVYSIEGPLFFAAVESMERALAHSPGTPRCLIIRLRRVPFMDITGLASLEDIISDLKRHGAAVKLCEANARVLRKLGKAGILQSLGSEHYHADLPSALASLQAAESEPHTP